MKKIFLILLIASITFSAFANDPVDLPGGSLTIPSVATNGMGGHHVAYTNNIYSLFVNPSAMARTRAGNYFTISAGVSSPDIVFNAIEPVMGMIEGMGSGSGNVLGELGGLLNSIGGKGGKIGLGLELRELPLLSFGGVYNGFGWGLFNRVFLDLGLNGTNVSAAVNLEFSLPLGFGFKIINSNSLKLDAGVAVKPFVRARYEFPSMDALDLMDEDKLDEIMDNLNIPVIAGGSLSAGLTLGLGNFKAAVVFDDIISYGVCVYDFNIANMSPNTPNDYIYQIPMTMNVGAAYELKLGKVLGLAVAADWKDVFNAFNQKNYLTSRNMWLDFSAGVELSLFNFLKIRAGVSELLPSVGLGLHLGVFKIDAALYGTERGYEPGNFPMSVGEISISFRL